MRLLCFPHAGGSASSYFPLSKQLAPEVEVHAVQYPGRQDRRNEACVDDISELAERICEAVSLSPEKPTAFLGHSMGAILAYEVARRLQRRGEGVPVHLFVSGRRAPSRPRREEIHRRGDTGLITEIRRLGGTDQRFLDDDELRAIILPMLRADYTAIETYTWDPAPMLECPLTALVGDADPSTTVEEASAWREQTVSGFDIRVFPGGHFFLDANRSEVAATITSALSHTVSASSQGRNR
ncbi:thioesterase II family protein [Nocardiopsis synnemataformans]|uniref:thioesterase II family protein n=1 Tax=Nocardiopsis synnemataformans TaxID=61305 RepID=UPI003EBCBF20